MLKKVLVSSMLLVLIIALVLSAFFSLEKPLITEGRDEYNNVTFLKDIPYYECIDSVFYDRDIRGIEDYHNKIYSYYGKYGLSEYQDGVCVHFCFINKKRVKIPEMLDGKKVVAFGYYSDEDVLSTAFEQGNVESLVTSIHIPSGVKYIANGTFTTESLKKLKWISVDKDNPYYFSFCGMLFSKETNELLCAPMFNYSAVPLIYWRY